MKCGEKLVLEAEFKGKNLLYQNVLIKPWINYESFRQNVAESTRRSFTQLLENFPFIQSRLSRVLNNSLWLLAELLAPKINFVHLHYHLEIIILQASLDRSDTRETFAEFCMPCNPIKSNKWRNLVCVPRDGATRRRLNWNQITVISNYSHDIVMARHLILI